MEPTYPSVAYLIARYSKARVLKAAPADPKAKLLGLQREMTDADAKSAMLRKYAR